MKIAFVCFEYCGARDAGSQCIDQLRSALYRQGLKSDVLTYVWDSEKETPVQDEFGTVYPTHTWYRYARVKRTANGTIRMSPAQWACVAAARGLATLLEGPHYAQRGVPVHAANHLGKRLRALCLENRYDWVVSVAYPFTNHLMAARWTPESTRLAFYNLDPYWNNGTYPPQLAASRAAEEADVYRKADCIFCTPEQLPDYQGPAFQKVADKVHPLPYPKLIEPKRQENCPIQFDPECINLLYLGTVYGDIRKPEVLFRLFEQALQREPRLRLYVIGKKFGAAADQYLTEYSRKLGDALICGHPIPSEQTTDLLLRADILVNMGNTVHNQMPSKLVEYIATGKPILNVSVDRDCNTLPLLKRYPICFQCFPEDAESPVIADELVRFCQRGKGHVLSWNAIENLYDDVKLDRVAENFLQLLSNC